MKLIKIWVNSEKVVWLNVENITFITNEKERFYAHTNFDDVFPITIGHLKFLEKNYSVQNLVELNYEDE